MSKVKVAPSILSADFSRMGEEIKRMEESNADMIHCDVMDGVFVPNITFGIKMVKDIRKTTSLPLDVHLMIVEPEKYVKQFVEAGADYVTIHVEATKHLMETLSAIRSAGAKCGAVISPDTPVQTLEQCLPMCDIVLLMSVYPGFGGQRYIPASTERLAALVEMRDRINPTCLVEIDGGVTLTNIAEITSAGADIVVAGNTVFSSQDPRATISALKGK